MSQNYYVQTEPDEREMQINSIFIKNKNKLHLPNIPGSRTRNRILEEIARYKSNPSVSLFITNQNNNNSNFNNKSYHQRQRKKMVNFKSYSIKDKNYKNAFKDINEFNIFNNEDRVLKDLMSQFHLKAQKNRISKLDKRKLVFNNLYGITPENEERLKIAKANKSCDLKEYQSNVLGIIGRNITDESKLRDLLHELKEIREENDSVKPFPPINTNIIEDHVKSKKKEKSIKKMTIKELIEGISTPLDEFEKEQLLIKNMKTYRSSARSQRNRKLDNVPEHLKNILSDKLKYFS